MVIFTLTKFGADWLIVVDARVLRRKLWMDGRQTDGHRRTVSDHNSSLSTPCSAELKRGFDAFAKCNHPCHPANSEQTDAELHNSFNRVPNSSTGHGFHP